MTETTRNWATPPVDILEQGNSIVLRTDLPGVRQEDVSLTLEDGTLHLKAVRPSRDLTYRRNFRLNPDLDPDSVSAELKAGVLELTLTRAVEATRTIPVRSIS